MVETKKKCEICGKEFTTYTRKAKYCSDECRKVAKSRYNVEANRKKVAKTRERLGTRICLICGKEFEPRNCTMVTCNPSCTRERHKMLKVELRKEQKEEQKKKKREKKEPMWKVNEKARAMGLSYGQYELMKRMEAQKKERSKRHGR